MHIRYIRFFISLPVLLLSVFQISGQQSDRFTGKFDPELAPDFVHIFQRVFEKVADSARPKFAPPIEKNALVTIGTLVDQRTVAGNVSAFLVEPVKAPPFLCIDINANGVIEAAERFLFIAQDNSPGDLDLLLRHPLTNPLFKDFPVFVRYKRGFKHPKLAAADRLVLQTVWALAYGTVDIRGKKVRVQYPFDPQVPTINTTEGLFGIDVDGDGVIRNEQFSPDTSYATKSEIVFRLGDLYVSTEKADLTKNEIVLRTRLREEYLRHEIAVGQVMPDFSFVDFEGKKRSLNDFRGKYLLVDFWGVWCVDCIRETPFHLEAMKRFRSRGFDILALDTDEDIEIVKPYLKKNGITWTQARNDSIRTLVESTYRIQEYPSTILLDPNGKVLVLDQNELRGEQLLATLDRLLPR